GKSTVVNLASFVPKTGFEKGVFYFGKNLELDSEDIENIKKTTADPNSFINRLRARTVTVLKGLLDEHKEKVEKIQKTLAGNKSRLEEIEKKILSAEERIDKQYKPLKSGGMNAATRQNIALAKELIK